MPYLPTDTLYARMKVQGLEHLPKPGDKPAIFISGHYGNWELSYPIAHNNGVKTSLIYRHANNPYVEKIIADLRSSRCAKQHVSERHAWRG